MICCFFLTSLFPAEKPDTLFKQAKKLSEKNPAQAVALYSEAIKISDSSWKMRHECYTERGILFFKAENLEQALGDFSMALSLNNKDFNAHKYTAEVLFMLRKYPESLQELDTAENLKDDAEVHYLRGRIFYLIFLSGNEQIQTNMLHTSRNEFTEAIELNRKYYEAYYQRGNIYVTTGDAENALKDFEHVLKYKKDYCPAYCGIAGIYILKKENLKAIEILEKCLKVSEKYKKAMKMLIKLLDQCQLHDKMKLWLPKALKFYPEDKFFRDYNNIYKTVPEETLPKLPEPKKPEKEKMPPPAKPKTPPKSVWLDVDENKDQEGNPEEKAAPPPLEKKPVTENTNNAGNWY